MRRSAVLLISLLLSAGAVDLRAQAVPAAAARQFSITAGGMASIFQPDFAGLWGGKQCRPSSLPEVCYPVAQASNQALFGAGAYVDVRLTRWFQIEAEGRWQRFNQFDDIYQDNFLIGPRVPVFHFRRSNVYAKALAGYSKMNFDPFNDHGKFTDLAFGGGVDVKLTKRLSFRAVDVEYQYWPTWGDSTLSPYGASMGIGYKIF
ncbi:MAG: outer membrane beta-barrel protein [Terracidiphilus sp.]|jgi:hypothetical protein